MKVSRRNLRSCAKRDLFTIRVIPVGYQGRDNNWGTFILRFWQTDSFIAAFARIIAGFLWLFIALTQSDYGKAVESPCCGTISAAGKRLEKILDNMNVESLWLPHERVNWETGQPDRNAD
jgi:hypothetical protein